MKSTIGEDEMHQKKHSCKFELISLFILLLFSPHVSAEFGEDGVSNCRTVDKEYIEICDISKDADVAFTTLLRFWKQNMHIEISNMCGFLRKARFHSDTYNNEEREKEEAIIENLPDGYYAEDIAGGLHLQLLDFLIENDGFKECHDNPMKFCDYWAQQKSEVYFLVDEVKRSDIKCSVN